MRAADTALRVLFADDALVAFNKPSGLSVHPGLDRSGESVVAIVRALGLGDMHPAHRLDRGTSGVLVFARTREAARSLGAQFSAHSIEKHYLALVRGEAPLEATVDHPVPKSEGGPRVPAWSHIARLAVSPVDELAGAPEGMRVCSLVRAKPESGRFHQVRRHLKHLGHPILGDANYGRGRLNRFMRDAFGLERLALHAEVIAFDHPTTGERVRIECELAEDLRGVVERLGLARSGERAGVTGWVPER